MKKTALFMVAAGFLAFVTLPATAQKTVAIQEVQKEAQKTQVANQTATPPATQAPGAPANVVNPTPPAPPVPLTCTWDVTDYDFGKSLMQNKPGNATFNLTNMGKEPVTITLVQPSCGCTAPKYTKEPIKPGEKGEVILTYNAAVSGFFSKSAQVKLNDGQKYQITIKGEVQKIEAAPATTTTPVPVVK
jgi:hypothetical protein